MMSHVRVRLNPKHGISLLPRASVRFLLLYDFALLSVMGFIIHVFGLCFPPFTLLNAPSLPRYTSERERERAKETTKFTHFVRTNADSTVFGSHTLNPFLILGKNNPIFYLVFIVHLLYSCFAS